MEYLIIYLIGFIAGLFLFTHLHGHFNTMAFFEALLWFVVLLILLVGIVYEVFKQPKPERYRGVSFKRYYKDNEVFYKVDDLTFKTYYDMKQYIDNLYDNYEKQR